MDLTPLSMNPSAKGLRPAPRPESPAPAALQATQDEFLRSRPAPAREADRPRPPVSADVAPVSPEPARPTAPAPEAPPVRLTMAFPPSDLAALAETPPVTAPATRTVVRDTVEQVLVDVSRQYPAEFIGVGSHVSGAGYRDPLKELKRVKDGGLPLSAMNPSDHDYRLILPGATDLEQIETRYREVRNRLASSLHESLTARGLTEEQVDLVVRNVNLYPPDEVLTAVATDAEANAFFKSRGLTPNLGGRDVDGLWGDGARTWVNHYEEKAGQLIFLEQGKVRVSRTDLTHLVEQGGYGRLTAEGSANLGAQFAEKGLLALDEGKTMDVVKDLKRLEKAMQRSRSLAMVPESGAELSSFLQVVDDLVQTNSGPTGELTQEGREALQGYVLQQGDLIRRELKLARSEAAVLQVLHKAEGGASKAFYRQLLQRSQQGPWSGVLASFSEQLERVDVGEMVDFAFRWGTMVDLVVQHYSATGDRNRTYEETLRLMEAMGSGTLGLTVAMVDVILQSAVASGIRFAAGAQSGEDLIGGIYSAWGAQDLRDGPLTRTVAQIASEFPDTSDGRKGLENLVRLHSMRLAENHNNPDPAFREQLQTAVFQKCMPEVMAAWRAARMEKIQEINRLTSGLQQALRTGEARLWLDESQDGHLSVPTDREPPLGVRTSLRSSLPRDLEAVEADLRQIRQLAFDLDHNGPMDNSSGRQQGTFQPVTFDIRTQLELHGPDGNYVAAHRQSLNQEGQALLETPALRATVDQFGWYRADLSAEVDLEAQVISEDLEQNSVLASLPGDLKLETNLDFQVARIIPDPASAEGLAGPWQAQDAAGRFGGSLDLRQKDDDVAGTYSSSFGVLPVSGSISEGNLRLVFHFDVGALGRVLGNGDLARQVGPVTAIAELEAAAGSTTLSGRLIPFNVHYNEEGVTAVFSGGQIDPKNPPRDFSLYRS